MDGDSLPPPPQRPLDSDCCGTGCTPCVFDLYDSEYKRWEQECGRIIAGRNGPPVSEDCVISKDEYREFKLASITAITSTTSCYRFLLPGHQCLPLAPGQHLVMRCVYDGETVVRQYTPISDPEQSGHFDVIIKLYEGGRMSRCIAGWQPDDTVQWRGPFGKFTYKANQYTRLILLAAGTGVAPMIQVVRAVLGNENDDTMIELVYCCKTYSDVLCKDLLDEWSSFWNFSVVYYTSQSEEVSNLRYGDRVVNARLSAEALTEVIGEDRHNINILICGTKSFDKDMVNYLKNLGVSEEYFVF